MILLIVLFSAILSTYFSWKSPLKALLNVYFPLLAFWPIGYGVVFHGATISPEVSASLPIVLTLIFSSSIRWKFQWVDLLVVLYILESFYSEYRLFHDFSVSGADAAGVCLVVLPAYFFGRYLIEAKSSRVIIVKRFVFLLFVVAILSVFEYRMAVNPFELLASRISSLPSTFIQQMRWGFARVGGPFGHAILAGIMFISALLFQLWLSSIHGWEDKFRRLRWLRGKKTTYITWMLVLGVWMTQSRGPWMGGALGLMLFLAGRARRIKRGITKAIVLSLLVFAVFYVVTDKYTDPGTGPMSQDQENAVYRRNHIKYCKH